MGVEDEGSAQSSDSSKTTETRRIRVLIVEDEPFVAMDAEAIVAGAGYHVVGMAISADEAVAKAEQLAADLVLMDIRLVGRRDGIDAAIEIRNRLNVPCIFVTANSDPLTRARAMQAAPLAFISKPFTAQTLLAALDRLAKRS
jgi:CheY-like chemotaxis protein